MARQAISAAKEMTMVHTSIEESALLAPSPSVKGILAHRDGVAHSVLGVYHSIQLWCRTMDDGAEMALVRRYDNV